MSEPSSRKTLLSRRVVRDMEHERYHPELEEEIKECLYCLNRNAMMFNLEVHPDLVEQRIYERQALLCRYRYLLQRARELGLHTILTGLPSFPEAGPGGTGQQGQTVLSYLQDTFARRCARGVVHRE